MNSKLILGTVQFGLHYGVNNTAGKPSKENIKSILDLAYNSGIQLLDTAEAYGDSQSKIGEYHKNSTNKFNIITKFSSNIEGLSLNIAERVYNNLKILDVDKLYCYMFHSFDDFNKYFEKYRKDLLILKRDGIINNIGVSLYSNDEIESILKFNEITLVQLPFNLLDNNNKRGYILKKAKAKGIEIHTRSAFLQGLFFKQIDSITGNLVNLKSDLKKIKGIVNSNEQVMASFALNYPMSKHYIDKVLMGVDSVDQLRENIKFLDTSKIEAAFKKIDKIEVENEKLLNPSLWKM